MYGIGGIAARIVSVVMLPIYTRYLAPAQYGLLQLLDISIEITAILFTAGTRSGLQRFYFKAQTDEERHRVIFTTWALEVVLSLAGSLALAASAQLLYRVVLVGEGSPDLIRIAALNFALGSLAFVPLLLLQIEQRALASTIAQLSKIAIQVALNLYFLISLRLGVAALLWSTAIASTLTGAVLVTLMVRRTGARVSRQAIHDLRRYGVPYQITTAAAFILTFGDRFFLQRSHGAAAVGLYALAYQFGFLLLQFSAGPFLRAWTPQRFAMAAAPPDVRNREYARGFLFLNILMLTMALGLTVFIRPALSVLTSAPYHGAAALVPLVLLAYVIHTWGEVVKFGIDVSERTALYTYASWIATAVVLVLYAVLIPPLGGLGAALATAIAFLVRFGLALYWSQRVWPVRYGWNRPLRLAAIAAAAAAPAIMWTPATMAGQLTLGAALVGAYAVLAWMLVLEAPHRAALVRAVRTRSLAELGR